MSLKSKFSLNGKVAIITGSGQGIGKAVALDFAEAGADIIVAELNLETAEQTAAEVRKLGKQALAVSTDVTSSRQIEAMVQAALERFKHIDILVNNAGGHIGRAPAVWLTEEEWNSILKLDLTSVFLCCKIVAPVMMRQKSGNIINMASATGQRASPGLSAYGATKAAVMNFSETLSRELADYHIRVNSIAASAIETGRTVGGVGGQARAEQFGIPLGRIGDPEDVAAAALYLASDASDWVTGIVIEVRGGPVTRKGDWELFKAKFPDLLNQKSQRVNE